MDDRWAIRSPPPSYGNDDNDARSVKDSDKQAIYVGQPQNLFCKGARFDGTSQMKIHPPPPGCEPNEYQSMLMNKTGDILFTPAPQRQAGTKTLRNRITPKITAVAKIKLAE